VSQLQGSAIPTGRAVQCFSIESVQYFPLLYFNFIGAWGASIALKKFSRLKSLTIIDLWAYDPKIIKIWNISMV